MRIAAALALLLLSAAAAAQSLGAPTDLHGAPGTVLALPLQARGGGTVELDVPQGFTLLGVLQPTPEDPRALATVLIGSSTRAGQYTLQARLRRDGATVASQDIALGVDRRVAIALRSEHPEVLEAGKAREIPVLVANDGNTPDTYALSVSGNDDVSLSVGSVTLEPGASTTVTLRLRPLGIGERSVQLEARSTVDPERVVGDFLLYRVYALGTTDPNAPVLSYLLPLEGSYGSDGIGYRAALALTGDLSAFAQTDDYASIDPEQSSASASLFGPDWGVVYGYGSGVGHDIAVTYHDLTLTAALDNDQRVSTGISYGAGNFRAGYQHLWGPAAEDSFFGGYSFSVSDSVELFPSVGVLGRVNADGTYTASPFAGGGVTWNGDFAIVTADVSVIPLPEFSWDAQLSASTRSVSPVFATASLNLTPAAVSGFVHAAETPDDHLSLSQSIGYETQGTGYGHLGVAYTVPDSPIDLVSTLDATLDHGAVSLRGQGALTRTELPWVTSVRFGVSSDVSVGIAQSYVASSWTVGGSVDLPLVSPISPLLTLGAAYGDPDVQLGASVDYDVGSDQLGGSALIGVQVADGLSLEASVGYHQSTGFTWKIGAAASVAGGVAVPAPIVDAFGGLDVGTVAGVVSARSSGGTHPLEGIVVELGDSARSTRTAADGSFRLQAPPGTYTLRFPDLAPTLLPPTDLTVTVERHVTLRKDVVAERVARRHRAGVPGRRRRRPPDRDVPRPGGRAREPDGRCRRRDVDHHRRIGQLHLPRARAGELHRVRRCRQPAAGRRAQRRLGLRDRGNGIDAVRVARRAAGEGAREHHARERQPRPERRRDADAGAARRPGRRARARARCHEHHGPRRRR